MLCAAPGARHCTRLASQLAQATVPMAAMERGKAASSPGEDDAAPATAKRALAQRIRLALTVLARIEEEIFYPQVPTSYTRALL